MNNKSVSDFVAASMNAVLNSSEHQSLFGGTYKTASDVNEVKDEEETSCSADSCDADDEEVDENDASTEDYSFAEDCEEDEDVSAAYDVAIDSLITASAALDSLGIEKGASVSLKLASLIVEAKKSDSKKPSKKSDKKSDSKKSDKKSDSKKSDKKSDPKKSDKKSDPKKSGKKPAKMSVKK